MGIRRINESMKTNDINEVLYKRTFNDINDSMSKSIKVGYTEHVADKLVKIYDAPKSRNFFLKCAWNLSEDTIWTAVEKSRKKGIECSVKYFIAICNKALRERSAMH